MKWLPIILVSALTAGAITYSILRTPILGATILSTASSDTLNTFRTNVNTSLANLNSAVVGIVSTSSPLTVSHVLYATGVNTMAGVATSTVTFSGFPANIPSTYGALVGGSNTTFNWWGLATTTQPSSSNLLVSNGASGVYGAATSTPTFGLGLTAGGTFYVLGSSPTLSIATSSLYTGTTGQLPYFSGINTLTATSTLFLSTAQNLGVGSSSPAFKLSVNDSGSDFYINSAGRVVARDTTNSWSGVLSPTRSFVLSTATTTTWTGTTSAAYVPSLTMPFTGTLRQARCTATSTSAFLNVAPFIGTTQVDSFVASTTVGVQKFTSNNTFTVGQAIGMYVGSSTASALNLGVSCTFDVTES